MLQGRRHRQTRRLHQAVAALRPLFGREFEVELLDSVYQKKPGGIQVVLGPRSCGKTAILKSYFAGEQNAVYIDCRAFNATSPECFIYTLLQQLLQKMPLDTQQARQAVLEMLAPVPGPLEIVAGLEITGKLGSTIGSEDAAISLWDFTRPLLDMINGALRPQAVNGRRSPDVFVVLGELLTAWEEALSGAGSSRWPVIVIDEANVLMGWDECSAELDALLRFFVLISEQDNRCHVLMAMSKHGYQAWINKGVGSEFWAPAVIGDFREPDARRFLEDQLVGSSVTVDDSAWAKVYEVCGGNAGALVRLALHLDWRVIRGNWDEALKTLWSVEAERMRVLALGGEGYTAAAQYADAAVQLLDTAHHAVAIEDMQLRLGRHAVGAAAGDAEAAAAGERVFQRMVEVNALSMRLQSLWARDVAAEAFERGDTVVTAPSALGLYCMRRLRPRLDKTLEVWKQQQEGATAAAAAAAAATGQTRPSPSSSPKLQAVEAEIEGAKVQVDGVDEEIKKARQEGDNEEVVALQAEKQQLRAKEQQLREQLLFLRAITGNGN